MGNLRNSALSTEGAETLGLLKEIARRLTDVEAAVGETNSHSNDAAQYAKQAQVDAVLAVETINGELKKASMSILDRWMVRVSGVAFVSLLATLVYVYEHHVDQFEELTKVVKQLKTKQETVSEVQQRVLEKWISQARTDARQDSELGILDSGRARFDEEDHRKTHKDK